MRNRTARRRGISLNSPEKSLWTLRPRRDDREANGHGHADGDGYHGSGLGATSKAQKYVYQPMLYRQPVALPRWRMALIRIAGVAALSSGGWYLAWRLSTLEGTGAAGGTLFIAELLNFFAVALTVFLFRRPRWRTGPKVPPGGTLDVFVTVCGEPVWLVERTLQAALAIGYPHNTYLLNDGLIAGEANWQQIEALAARWGVECFTRPSGTRGKAGNLNYALARTGGDFVATIDADHQARPGFATEVLGYFSESDVGFVASAQQFEGEESDLLNNRELLFYRYMQAAKDADDASHSCGSGVVYRRTALTEIGGFSEWGLVEDVHTSYQLHARGWKSVYHPRSLTLGLAPQTVSALVRQRLRWATDALRILLWDNPLLKPGLTLQQRLHYLHSTSYYLIACTHLVFAVSPALYLVWGVELMQVPSAATYLAHSLPYFGSLFLLLFLCAGVRGGLRTLQSGLALAPIFLLALLRAATRVRFVPGVSEKEGRTGVSPLVLPQFVLMALLLVGIGFAVRGRGEGSGIAAAWAGWMGFSLAAFATAVSARRYVWLGLRLAVRVAIIVAVAAIALPIARVQHSGPPAGGIAADVLEGPRPLIAEEAVPVGMSLTAPERGAYLGFYNPLLLKRGRAVDTWAAKVSVNAVIVHWYQQWFSGQTTFHREWAETIAGQGAVPMITWEPWSKPVGSVHDPDQQHRPLSAIASGRYDSYIRDWARGAASYGGPLLIRPMHEMNGDWYPWSIKTNGNTGKAYVGAWRRIHEIFEEEGAVNVDWVWSINTFRGLTDDDPDLFAFYPGARYVDWVAASGFNWGRVKFWKRWHTFREIFGSTYEALSRFGKPIMISEIATVSAGGDAAAWVRDSLQDLRRNHPLVKAVVWFDSFYPNADLRLNRRSAAAFAKEVQGSNYWRQEPHFIRVTEALRKPPEARRPAS
jgi:cellulose synthase (UDP-forming)